MAKIQHIYKVIRTFEVDDADIKEEREFFKGVQDEPGEYLYGGTGENETIEVKFKLLKSDKEKLSE